MPSITIPTHPIMRGSVRPELSVLPPPSLPTPILTSPSYAPETLMSKALLKHHHSELPLHGPASSCSPLMHIILAILLVSFFVALVIGFLNYGKGQETELCSWRMRRAYSVSLPHHGQDCKTPSVYVSDADTMDEKARLVRRDSLEV